jgi:hypothetical protein
MRSSDWRHYRGHLIVKTRSALLGLRRFEVWDGPAFLGTFSDVIRAEVHIDHRLANPGGSSPGRSGTLRTH